MKTAIITLGILTGCFLPFRTFSVSVLLSCIFVAAAAGFYLPDMFNANDLSDNWDLQKPNLKDRISISRSNTISLWFAVFVFTVATTGEAKSLILSRKIDELSLVVMVFSLAAFLRLHTARLVSRRFL